MKPAPLLLGALFACTALPAIAQPSEALRGITGRLVLAISDGDYAASSYRDGVLADQARGLRDVLSVLQLQGGTVGRIEVSNAVTATPDILDISPDGRFAFVAEMLGQRPTGGTHRRDLQPGTRVFSIDLVDAGRPVLRDTTTVSPEPQGLKVSPDGRHLAIASSGGDRARIDIVPVSDGRLGTPQSFPLDELGVAPEPGRPRGGLDVSLVDWHPSGEFVSATLFMQNEVAFFRLARGSDGAVRLLPWGRPVAVGRDPFVGRFTPDGRHFISADWGRDFAATDIAGRLPSEPSRLSVIRLAEDGQHQRVQSIASDRSSEGLAISRDGRLVATVNMRETALQPGHPRQVADATVSLFRFDAAAGQLVQLGNTPFAGILPEGAAFDRDGKHLLVSVFEYAAAAGAPASGLEVFRIIEGGSGLDHVGRVPLPHGAHHVVVVP